MTLSLLITCFLGYDSNTCDLPQPCSNFRFCQWTAAAWPLPFYVEDYGLIVSFSRVNIRESWHPIIIRKDADRNPIPQQLSGYASELFGPYHGPLKVSDSIKLLWEQAGWMPAVTNPNYPWYLDPDYDPIPF